MSHSTVSITVFYLQYPQQFFLCKILVTCFSCGLVALKLAAQILKISSKSGEGEIEALLKVAQENGFTYHGEMFSAQDMGSLARKYYKLSCNVVENGLNDIEKLKEHLCMGHPVLVPYDADKNHEPCLKRGHKAHWAVITGSVSHVEQQLSHPICCI